MLSSTHSASSLVRARFVVPQQHKHSKMKTVAAVGPDQSELTILVTCMQVSCMEQSCAVFGARNLYKKNLVQQTMSDGQVSCTSRLVQVSCTSFLTVCHHHK